jgi:hypothetical protein
MLSLACCSGKHFFNTAEEGENVTGGGLGMESAIDVAAAAASSEGDAWCLREAEWVPGIAAVDVDVAVDSPLWAVRICHLDVGVRQRMWTWRQRRGS